MTPFANIADQKLADRQPRKLSYINVRSGSPPREEPFNQISVRSARLVWVPKTNNRQSSRSNL